jgi:hypothetical protein
MPPPVTQLRIQGDVSRQMPDSSLAYLMQLVEAAGSLSISFEDLVGVTYDHLELRLPDEMRMHTGPLVPWEPRTLSVPVAELRYSAGKFKVRQYSTLSRALDAQVFDEGAHAFRNVASHIPTANAQLGP